MSRECCGLTETDLGYRLCSFIARFFCYLAFISQLWIYNVVFLRQLLPQTRTISPLRFGYGVIFNVLWLLAFVSYLRAQFTNAGGIPLQWLEFVRNKGEGIQIQIPMCFWQPGSATLCKECKVPRPERTHHCSRCGVCVLRYDHHCIWINNCIGFKNHKYFLLLGVYTCLLSWFTLFTTLPEAVPRVFKAYKWFSSDFESGLKSSEVVNVLLFLVSTLCVAQLIVSLTIFVWVFGLLAAKNLTKVEEMIQILAKTTFNPYDEGSCIANLSQIFGRPGLDWFLPIEPWHPISDGIAYKARKPARNSLHSTPSEFQDDAEEAYTCGSFCVANPMPSRTLRRYAKANTEDLEDVWSRHYRPRQPLPDSLTPKSRGWFSRLLFGASPQATDCDSFCTTPPQEQYRRAIWI